MNKIKGMRGHEFESEWHDWATSEDLSTEEAERLVKGSPINNTANLESNSRECLGLHFEHGKLKASHFVGQVWLKENEAALQIGPKRQKDVDYFKMTAKCLSHPVVGGHIIDDKCFHFEAEKAPIPLGQTIKDSVILLLVAQYLKELFWLCKRHLRRGFPRIERNLTGRCKGRVLIKENIIHNSARGRFDRLYCQYQIHTMDTLENQILRAALEQSLRVLRAYAGKDSLRALWGWANEPANTLSGVKVRRIYPSEFHQIRYSGSLKVYKKPHALAKMILSTLGTDPNRPKELNEIELPPFSIDMNELFERYCDVLLRRKYKEGENLWIGYENLTRHWREWPLRPDYLIKGAEKAIIDAKYKYHWGDDGPGNKKWRALVRNDVYQVVTYSRHKEILKWLWNAKENDGCHAELRQKCPDAIYILYPTKEGKQKANGFELKLENNSRNEVPGFIPSIYRIPIPLPLKHS